MKIFPRTLLGRTTLLLGVILVIGSVSWTAAIGYFLLRPLRSTYTKQITDTIAMAQALLSGDEGTDASRLGGLPFTKFSGLRVVADSGPLPAFLNPTERTLPSDILEELRAQLGPAIELKQQRDTGGVWIRFPAGPRYYWLVVPISPPAVFPYPVLIWIGGGFALSIGGAYLIIFQLTRRLRQITDQVRAFGQNGAVVPLDETGPMEVRALSAGFNQMAGDLQRHEGERRLMLAGISHDLRTPLTRIRLAAELVEPKVDPQLGAGMIQDIEEMDSILRQFLDYARDGSEEAACNADLNEIVREVCSRYLQGGHTLAVRLGALPEFLFRPLALRRVVTNLVENGVRYGRLEIEVQTGVEAERFWLEVRDRGPGVPAELLASLNRPFVRGSAARLELGSGLGLAIVDRIVRSHGGQLELRNRPEGGFLARVKLPQSGASNHG